MVNEVQLSDHGTLDIVSFNLWDAPMVAAVRLPRMKALASFLRTRRGDVWACQELFHDDACELIGSAAKEVGLVHSVRFQAGADLPNGASGCGVVIFSRWPIVESMFHRCVSSNFDAAALPAHGAACADSPSMAVLGIFIGGTGMLEKAWAWPG